VSWPGRDAEPALFQAVIRVHDATNNVTETHEHKGDFKEW
jgi:hypothetical protein